MAGINNTLNNGNYGLLPTNPLQTKTSTVKIGPTSLNLGGLVSNVAGSLTGADLRPGYNPPSTTTPNNPGLLSGNTEFNKLKVSGGFGGNQNKVGFGGSANLNQVNNTQGGVAQNQTEGVLGLFPSVAGSLAGMASGATSQYQQAQNQYLEANKELAGLKENAAQQAANIGRSRTDLSEAGGEQGILQNLLAGKESALTGEMAAAQAAAQAATGQQGTQQSGLAAAGGLAQPTPANALGFFNPTEGNYNPYGATGGVGAGGQVVGQYGAAQNFYANLVPSYNQAQSVYQGLTDFLQNNPSINPSDANFVNNMNAWARGQQLSDPKYQQFTQFLNELLQTLTPIVGSQGVSDYKSQLVQTMVNPTSSTESIQQQIDNLMQIATGKMQATQQSFTSSQPFQPNGTANFSNLFSW